MVNSKNVNTPGMKWKLCFPRLHCHRPQKLQGFPPSLFEGEYYGIESLSVLICTHPSASSASQKVQDKYAVASVKSRTASLPQSESEGRPIRLGES